MSSGQERQRRLRGEAAARLTQPDSTDVRSSVGSSSLARLLRLRIVHDDYLACRTWDGAVQGDTDVLVAKPWALRRTPFDGQTWDGVSYVYTSATLRQAIDGAQTRYEVPVPAYVVGGLILCLPTRDAGTLVSVDGVDLNWIEVSARAWAVMHGV